MQAILTRGALLSLLVAGSAHAEPIALVGGDVYTVSGAMLPGATVVMDKGKITAVGLDVAIPSGARVIDVRGKRVTPGLVDVDTQIGLLEIELEASTVDAFPRTPDPIRAAVYAGDAIDPLSTLVGVARRHGVTSVVSHPGGGLVAGRGAWLDLVGPRSPELYSAVIGPASLHVQLGEGGAEAVGGSRALAMSRLREAFDDARTFRAKKGLYERGDMYDMRTSRLDLQALEPALRGRLPVIVEVNRAADILAALKLAKEEGLDIAILGGADAWLVADALAKAKVPVIVNPLADLPSSFESRYARADNAALLAQAGVHVAISTRTSHNASGLRFHLANAVRAGLPPELALRAATLVPAEIFGMKGYGALERGKVANVVVWSGDPFEPSSYAETIIIRGEVQPTESRQTALAKKYIQRVLK